MFIGHYGPAFGAKAAVRRLPLWVYFLAVQWLDVVWSIFVLMGVEHLKVQPGFMPASPLILYDMPYTHGLFGALALSVLLGAVVALFVKAQKGAVFLSVALAAFSHWLLDLVVHAPDLWIYGSLKVGFGLWHYLWLSLGLELALLAAGAALYARFVPARRGGNLWLWVFVAALAAVEVFNMFGPAPTAPKSMAESALAAYLVLAGLAGLVDLTRMKG